MLMTTVTQEVQLVRVVRLEAKLFFMAELAYLDNRGVSVRNKAMRCRHRVLLGYIVACRRVPSASLVPANSRCQSRL